MLSALLLMAGLGLASAGILAIASRLFYVKVDPRLEAVESALPGANCGGCGYPGCAAMAEAIIKGKADPGGCVAGGPDVALAVGDAMGIKVEIKEPEIAVSFCLRGDRAELKYIYEGAEECRAAAMLYGGGLECRFGCLGFGSCIQACQFDAISMGENGLPVFDPTKCVGCGACEQVCPQGTIRLFSLSGRLLHLHTEDECLAPCRQLCPAQIDVPAYIKAAAEGRYEDAIRIIKQRNPLPLTCGRVCPAPCEEECRHIAIGDEPVKHNYIKRFLADYEMNRRVWVPLPVLPDTGKKVAVIGGGPAGLTCAYFLRRLGHSVTIFEALPQLGGMLRYGIPEYRFPKEILDWDINGILRLGIETRMGVRFGEDITFSGLEEEGYEAFFLGHGAWINSQMRIEGEDLDGVWSATEFLSCREKGEPAFIAGHRVVVVGGGNTAIDAARTALRYGAREVKLLYRRSRAEMPANKVEIEAADDEGIELILLAAPIRCIGKDGKLAYLIYERMVLGEPDASGRRRPVPIPDSETIIEVDTVMAAIGQSADPGIGEGSLADKGLELTRWGTPEADPVTLQTSVPNVFCGGDGFTGPALVVDAIGAGRRAARSIHYFLEGKEIPVPHNLLRGTQPESRLTRLEGVVRSATIQMPELTVSERIGNFKEVDQTVSRSMVQREAERCLLCGTICYNHLVTESGEEGRRKIMLTDVG